MIVGITYTQNVFVKFKFFIVINIGIRPALKYIVITTNRYQNFRFHILSCVNINPRNAVAITVSAVPMTVFPMDTRAALPRPFNSNSAL